VQVDPIKPKLKPPGTERLKLKCDTLLSNCAFIFNLRRYNAATKKADELLAHTYNHIHGQGWMLNAPFPDCSLIVYRCTRTRSPYPPHGLTTHSRFSSTTIIIQVTSWHYMSGSSWRRLVY
jgi:hypothetical protein